MKRIHCWKRIWIAILVWSILVWIPNTHVFAHSMPQTDLLQTRLAMTQSELSFLQSRLERVKDTTGKILQALHTVRNTSDKLNRLNQQMTAINTILLGLQAVPYAGPILGRIRTVLIKVKNKSTRQQVRSKHLITRSLLHAGHWINVRRTSNSSSRSSQRCISTQKTMLAIYNKLRYVHLPFAIHT